MHSRDPLVFLHDRLIPRSEAHLPLHDAGFVWGATATDLCRTFQGRLFRFEEHLQRWRDGCRALGLDIPLSDAEIARQVEELVAHNFALLPEGEDLAVVTFATPGAIGYYLGEEGGGGDRPATFGIHTFQLPLARYRSLFVQGARLWVPTVQAMPAACIDPRIKHRSRLHWWLADREVRDRAPGHQALLRDEMGRLTETAAGNFLIVQDRCVLAPPIGTVLEGISMGVAAELCAHLKIPFVRQAFTLEDALLADEALLTGTAFCLAGVSRLQDRDFSWPGPVLRLLQQAWSETIAMDFSAQFLRNRPG